MEALAVAASHPNHAGLRPNLNRVSAIPDSDGRRRKRKSDQIQEIKEEEINRYMAKKAIKAANKIKDKFVWRKKIEHNVARGVPFHDFTAKAERNRQRKRMEEVEKIKKRREQRQVEKAQREEEIALLARDRARSEAEGFEKKAREFELSQSKIRSRMRLIGGRAKPIDLLTTYVDDSSEFVQYNEPYQVFKGLKEDEIERLGEEIKMYVDLDRETPIHVEYWEAVLVVCDSELAEARRKNGGKFGSGERGIHPRVEEDVRKGLEGRNREELVVLQYQIESDMRTGRAMEVEFWEEVLKLLPLYKAKACLKEIRAEKLRKWGGSFSRKLLDADETEGVVIDTEEDKAKDDKFCPRKPKYLNRVLTGYQWNKYNRVHYDHDNPPPKFVQGYKFNIFYPDLVDKSKSPYYIREKDEDSTEIIRFHAGAPYEDIAFRIVDNDWEYSSKKGFKRAYEGGILKLYFNFKRPIYRR